MPDRPDDLNPIADALARLAPQPPTLSRDALLFAAGQAAAAPRTPAWVWPSAAAFFACLSLVLTAFLLSPGTGSGEVRYVTQYVMLPPSEPATRAAVKSQDPLSAKAKNTESPPDETLPNAPGPPRRLPVRRGHAAAFDHDQPGRPVRRRRRRY